MLLVSLFIPVVVVFSFFLCWSPFHSQRLMFVLVTLYGRWTKTLLSAQHILFITSGNLFTQCVQTFYILLLLRCILLFQLCLEPYIIFFDVQEISAWFFWHQTKITPKSISTSYQQSLRWHGIKETGLASGKTKVGFLSLFQLHLTHSQCYSAFLKDENKFIFNW